MAKFTVSVLAPDYLGSGNVGEDIYLAHVEAKNVEFATCEGKAQAALAWNNPEAAKDFALLHVFKGHVCEAFDD
jgi:hypothetical protein